MVAILYDKMYVARNGRSLMRASISYNNNYYYNHNIHCA